MIRIIRNVNKHSVSTKRQLNYMALENAPGRFPDRRDASKARMRPIFAGPRRTQTPAAMPCRTRESNSGPVTLPLPWRLRKDAAQNTIKRVAANNNIPTSSFLPPLNYRPLVGSRTRARAHTDAAHAGNLAGKSVSALPAVASPVWRTAEP